jgi:predicted porin
MMKRKLLTMALMAAGTTTFAQSSVNLSGRIDLALRSVDDGVARNTLVQRDGSTSSRLVFSGIEDLGGGLKAGFFLDSQVRADTGTAASTFWERRSTVSLLGPFGEIRLGRDAALQNSGPGDFDSLNGKGVGNVMNLATPFNFSNVNTFTRVNNAVSYLTPNSLGGFYGQVQIGLHEGTKIGNKHEAFSAGFKNKALEARLTYGQTEVNSVGVVNPVTGVSTAQATPTGKFKYTVAGVSYDFGVIRVMGSATQWDSAKTSTGASRKQMMYNLGGMVPVGAGSVNFAYTIADRSGLGSDAQDASQFGIQYMYPLSKRTSLYASAARLSQKALAASDTASAGGRYNLDGTTVLGRTSTGFDFGIAHRF